jgi:hypothetical protein
LQVGASKRRAAPGWILISIWPPASRLRSARPRSVGNLVRGADIRGKPGDFAMSAQPIPSASECRWYHTLDLPELGTVQGDWDLRGQFDRYIGHIDLKGKTVLDVGTASGFLAFEAEKRGATVYTFDADSHERIQLLPPKRAGSKYFDGMRNGYRLAHHVLKSKVTPIYGDIYRMSEMVPRCDVVLVAQVLVHLRDPVGGLHQASLSSNDYLIIVEDIYKTAFKQRRRLIDKLLGRPHRLIESNLPVAYFSAAEDPLGWWKLSLPLYKAVLSKFGFSIEGITRNGYRSHGTKYNHELTTIVARRS